MTPPITSRVRRQTSLGVVLHPAGLRRDLLVLALVDADDPPVGVEQDAPGARGPLIDRCDVVAHGGRSVPPWTISVAEPVTGAKLADPRPLKYDATGSIRRSRRGASRRP